jgi:hypothetical protein
MAATIAGLAKNDKRDGRAGAANRDRSNNNRSTLVVDSGAGKNTFKVGRKSITPTNQMNPSNEMVRKTPLGKSRD